MTELEEIALSVAEKLISNKEYPSKTEAAREKYRKAHEVVVVLFELERLGKLTIEPSEE